MENRLKKLFEYQRFEGNSRLQKLIAESESRSGAELSDDQLELVAAAGDPGQTGRDEMPQPRSHEL